MSRVPNPVWSKSSSSPSRSSCATRNVPPPPRSAGHDQRPGGEQPLSRRQLDRERLRLARAQLALVEPVAQPRRRLEVGPALGPRPVRLVAAERARERGKQLLAQLVGVVRVDVRPAADARDAAHLAPRALVEREPHDRDRQLDAAPGDAPRGGARRRRRAVVEAVGDEDDLMAAPVGPEVAGRGQQRTADRRPALALQPMHRVAQLRAVAGRHRCDELGVGAGPRAALARDARAVDAQPHRRLPRHGVEHLVHGRLGRVQPRPAAITRRRVHRPRRVEHEHHGGPVAGVGRRLRHGRPSERQRRQTRESPGARDARSGAENFDLSAPCCQTDGAQPSPSCRRS